MTPKQREAAEKAIADLESQAERREIAYGLDSSTERRAAALLRELLTEEQS